MNKVPVDDDIIAMLKHNKKTFANRKFKRQIVSFNLRTEEQFKEKYP